MTRRLSQGRRIRDHQAGGTISGRLYGIAVGAGAGTIVNAGGLSGKDAVYFSAGYNNRLIDDPGATFSGPVLGGNTAGGSAVSTLELASGSAAGTLAGLGHSSLILVR